MRRARDELIANVTEDVARWAAVQAVLATTVPSATFKKKLKAATWVEAELMLKGEKTFPPDGGHECGGSTRNASGGEPRCMGEALDPGKKSICDPALRWSRDDLHKAPLDDEPDVDLDVARQPFWPDLRAVPQDPLGMGDRCPAHVPLH